MASNVKRDHHLWTRDTVKNVSGDVTLDIGGDIELNADGGDITFKDEFVEFLIGYLKNSFSYSCVCVCVLDL